MRRLLQRPRQLSSRVNDSLERWRYSRVLASVESEAVFSGWLTTALDAGKPLMVSRLGNVESRIMGEFAFRGGRYGRKTYREAHQNAGIFPVEPWLLHAFSRRNQQALSLADWLGFWQSEYQAALLGQISTLPRLCELSSLEPYLSNRPWSSALAGRRVLVVHPFVDSIRHQYSRRSELFADQRVLPSFELEVLKPPQTLAPACCKFSSWLQAIDHLEAQVLERTFDVALIGCGAYGLPLAAAIKRSGRQAIHLGGALQVLFGIRGRRWDALPQFQQLFTPGWCRPNAEEVPISAENVEGGCYW